MKRFDKDAAGDGKRGQRRGPPPSSFRDRPQAGARQERRGGFGGQGFEARGEDSWRQGGGYKGRDSRGGDERPRRFDDRNAQGPRNTFRRDGGPSGGYGRPSFRPEHSGGDRSAGYNSGHAARNDTPSSQGAPAHLPSASKAQPIALHALKKGLQEANRALAEVVEQFGHTIEGGYDISELQVTVAFGPDGRFLGFGQGGAATMTLSITPLDGEALFEAEQDGTMQAANEQSSASGLDDSDFELGDDSIAMAADDDDDSDDEDEDEGDDDDDDDDDEGDDDDQEEDEDAEDAEDADNADQAGQSDESDDREMNVRGDAKAAKEKSGRSTAAEPKAAPQAAAAIKVKQAGAKAKSAPAAKAQAPAAAKKAARAPKRAARPMQTPKFDA